VNRFSYANNYQDGEVNEDKIDRTCSTNLEEKNAFRIIVVKSERRRSQGRRRH
jgi:hypothetical protein